METLQTPPRAPHRISSGGSSPPVVDANADVGRGLGLIGAASPAAGAKGPSHSAPNLQSPGIKVELHGGDFAPSPQEATASYDTRPPLAPQSHTAPPVQQYQSPMRQHKRTPSQHRKVKETLNARSEYTSDDADGRSHHAINQYTIMEEIGRGSYGAVHHTVDQFGNDYAVKEFSKTRLRKRAQSNILRRGPRRPGRLPLRAGMGSGPGPGMDPSVSSQLSDHKAQEAKDALFLIREEIAIMKKLNHPNLVSLIEVLDDPEEDSLYMVLEMCKKGVIMNVGLDEVAVPYVEEECRCWFRDLILGIEYLHAQGVVHRDIKPDNLLLTDDDVLKIVDFGVSEMFEKPEQMRTAKSAGSPAFLPPELCVAKHGDVSGTAADIWSMGVTLYCLRYGRIPFHRLGVLEMYDAIKTDTPAIPEDENPSFKDLIMRLMEKDPEKRITMPEIREHPWVTKEGTDPLLSAEENCSDLVDDPNEMEVNHAFTRRMSHLLCVMKAISNFKALLPSRSRIHSPRLNLSPEDAASSIQPHPNVAGFRHKPKPSMDEQEMANMKRQNEEHAARLLEERRRVLQHRSNSIGDSYIPPTRNDTPVVSDGSSHGNPAIVSTPPILGVGTGGYHEYTEPESNDPSSIIADSPTAVDFNVYDRAYEEELERIKRNGGKPGVYMTRHVNSTDRLRMGRETDGDGGKPMFKQNRFADLVAQTIKDSKTKAETQEEGNETDENMREGE